MTDGSVWAHYRHDTVDARNFQADPAALDAVGRMGGQGYARTGDDFDLPTMSVEHWREHGRAGSARVARRLESQPQGGKR